MSNKELVTLITAEVLKAVNNQNKPQRGVTNKSPKVKDFKMFTVHINKKSASGADYAKKVVGTTDTKLAKVVFDSLTKSGYKATLSGATNGKDWQLIS